VQNPVFLQAMCSFAWKSSHGISTSWRCNYWIVLFEKW